MGNLLSLELPRTSQLSVNYWINKRIWWKRKKKERKQDTYLLSFSGEAWNASILGRAREKRSREVRVAHDDVSSSTYAWAVLVYDVYGGTRFRRKFQLPWNCDTIIREAKHRLYFTDISATKPLPKKLQFVYSLYYLFFSFKIHRFGNGEN